MVSKAVCIMTFSTTFAYYLKNRKEKIHHYKWDLGPSHYVVWTWFFSSKTSSCPARKVMGPVFFWDVKGILLVDYFQAGKKICSVHYCKLLDLSDEKNREKYFICRKRKISFIKTMHLFIKELREVRIALSSTVFTKFCSLWPLPVSRY